MVELQLDHGTGRRGGPDEHSPKKGRLNCLNFRFPLTISIFSPSDALGSLSTEFPL